VEILQAVLTAALGLLGYVTGQIVVKFCEPAMRLRALFGAVARDLLFFFEHTQFFSDKEARAKAFRTHAAAIHENLHAVMRYEFLRLVFDLPPKAAVINASRELFALSLSELEEYSVERHKARLDASYRITKLLRLPPLPGGWEQGKAYITAT